MLDAIPVAERWGRVIDAADMGGQFLRSFVEHLHTLAVGHVAHHAAHALSRWRWRAGTSLFEVSQLVGDTYAPRWRRTTPTIKPTARWIGPLTGGSGDAVGGQYRRSYVVVAGAL